VTPRRASLFLAPLPQNQNKKQRAISTFFALFFFVLRLFSRGPSLISKSSWDKKRPAEGKKSRRQKSSTAEFNPYKLLIWAKSFNRSKAFVKLGNYYLSNSYCVISIIEIFERVVLVM